MSKHSPGGSPESNGEGTWYGIFPFILLSAAIGAAVLCLSYLLANHKFFGI